MCDWFQTLTPLAVKNPKNIRVTRVHQALLKSCVHQGGPKGPRLDHNKIPQGRIPKYYFKPPASDCEFTFIGIMATGGHLTAGHDVCKSRINIMVSILRGLRLRYLCARVILL